MSPHPTYLLEDDDGAPYPQAVQDAVRSLAAAANLKLPLAGAFVHDAIVAFALEGGAS